MKDTHSSIVEEPAISFISAQIPLLRISEILGENVTSLNNEEDVITHIRNGIPRSSLDNVAMNLGVTIEELSRLLHISYRTILRKNKNDKLSFHISEHLFILARVIQRGGEVFEDSDTFKEWLRTNIPSLNHRRPLDYLDTSFGTDMVLNLLGRIEHGIY